MEEIEDNNKTALKFNCMGIHAHYAQTPNELHINVAEGTVLNIDEVTDFYLWLADIQRTMEDVAAERHMRWQANQNAPRLGVAQVILPLV